jgi:hypothetical protein
VDENGDPVPGAKFLFVGQGVILESVSDQDGYLISPCLAPGVYDITETYAPDGYIRDGQTHTLTIDMNGTFRLDGQLNGRLVNKTASGHSFSWDFTPEEPEEILEKIPEETPEEVPEIIMEELPDELKALRRPDPIGGW